MKRLEMLSAMLLLFICGFIGYSTNYVDTARAEAPIIPKIVEVPKTTFNLDFNNEQLSADSKGSIQVNIVKKDSIIYRTKYVEVEKPYIVRETMPVRYKYDGLLMPDETGIPEKINLARY